MRVGIVYQLHRNRCPKMREWVADGFRQCGADVVLCDGPKTLPVVDERCDLVVFEHKGAGIPIGALWTLAPQHHAFWCSWNFDLAAVQPDTPLSEQLTMQKTGSAGTIPTPWLAAMRLMDLAFVKEWSRIGEYEALGVRAAWLDQGCPDTMPEAKLLDAPPFDVLVLGTKSRAWKQRLQDATLLARHGFRVAWVGPSDGDAIPECIRSLEPVPPLELPRVISQAACVLGVDFTSSEPGYWSDRQWLVCGAGGLLLRPAVERLPAGPYVTYHDADSLIQQAESLLRQPEMRRATAAAARRWVFESHLYRHRCQQLLDAVEQRQLEREGARCKAKVSAVPVAVAG